MPSHAFIHGSWGDESIPVEYSENKSIVQYFLRRNIMGLHKTVKAGISAALLLTASSLLFPQSAYAKPKCNFIPLPPFVVCDVDDPNERPNDNRTKPQTIEPSARTETYYINLSARQHWLSTGIYIEPGQVLQIRANGQWTNGGNQPQLIGAGGYGDYYRNDALESTAPFASLIARVGNSSPFFIGTNNGGTINKSGELYLSMNDIPGTFDDNSGTLSLEIYVE